MDGFQPGFQPGFEGVGVAPAAVGVPAGLLFDPRRARFRSSVNVHETDPRVRIYTEREIARAIAKFVKKKTEDEWLLDLISNDQYMEAA